LVKNYDDILVKKFNEGDALAFKHIYDKFFGQILYFCRRLAGDEAGPEITTETFHKLYKLRANFESLVNVRAFLYITARNACFNYIKSVDTKRTRQKEYLQTISELQEGELEGYELKLSDEIRAAFVGKLYELISKLPKRRGLVLKLMFFEGLSPTEIANVLKISVNSVRNHKVQALKSLKLKVSELGIKLQLSLILFSLLCSFY
jgi:RNA polymerase sigma-70 factor (ECF subfamily)